MFLELADALLDIPPQDQAFSQTIADHQQRIAQNSIQIDHTTLELAAKAAIADNRVTLVPHLLRIGLWLHLISPPTFYENICTSLIMSRKWNTLRAVLRFCDHYIVKPTCKLLNIRLRSHLHSEAYSALQLISVKQMFAKHGRQFDRETFNILIEASIANRDMEACCQIILLMTGQGFEIDEETHRAILARMVAMGPNQELETTIFTSLRGVDPSLDTAILNSLIRLRSIARDDAMLKKYVSYLRRSAQPNFATSKPAPALYWNANPDISTISTLIEHFGRRRQLNAALEAFRLIDTLKLEASTEAVAHMIYAYGRCGKIQNTLSLTAELSKSLPLTQRERAYKLLRQLGWDGSATGHNISNVTANVYIFNALLKVVIAEHGLDALIVFLDLMEVHHISPDDETGGIYLASLNKYGNTTSDNIIYTLHRLAQYGLNWRQRHVNAVLYAIMGEHKKLMFGPGGWKGASAFESPNRERRIRGCFTIRQAKNVFEILDGSARPKDAYDRRLRAILSTVDESGARHDHATYCVRMMYHARLTRDAEKVEDIYNSMIKNGLTPNGYHVAALMEAFCFTGQIEKAQATLSRAVSDEIAINCVHYTLLIRDFGNRGDPDSAYRIYKRMIDDKVTPDIAALDAVIRAYFMTKDYISAKKVLFQLWGTVLPRNTLPPSSASLGEAMERLRALEKMRRPGISRNDKKDASTVKKISTKWRRTVLSAELRATRPALRGFKTKLRKEEHPSQTDKG